MLRFTMFVTVSYSYAWPSIRLQWLTESVPGDEWDFYLLTLLILEDIPTFQLKTDLLEGLQSNVEDCSDEAMTTNTDQAVPAISEPS
jgi:hypothetical protein